MGLHRVRHDWSNLSHVIIIHSYFTIVVCLFFLFLLSIYFWYLSLFASLYPLRVNLSYTRCSLFSAISLMSAEKPPDHQSFLYLGRVLTHSPFSRRSLTVTDIWSGFVCLYPVCSPLIPCWSPEGRGLDCFVHWCISFAQNCAWHVIDIQLISVEWINLFIVFSLWGNLSMFTLSTITSY